MLSTTNLMKRTEILVYSKIEKQVHKQKRQDEENK
jgi:hypothetical protein